MAVTKARLVKAAEDLNKVLGLEPAIDVEADENTLVTDILEAAELLQPEDKLTKATLKVIADLESGRDAGDTDSDEDVAEVTDEVTVNASEDTSDEDTAQDDTETTTTNDDTVKEKDKSKSKSKSKSKTTPLGSRVGTQAEKMDLIMLNADGPLTVEELSEKSGFTKGRVKIHLNYLMKKGVLEEKDGRYHPQPKK